MTSLLDVYNEWQNNPVFREELKKDPLLALQKAGFQLSAEDLEKIQAMVTLDKSKNDQLDDRINK